MISFLEITHHTLKLEGSAGTHRHYLDIASTRFCSYTFSPLLSMKNCKRRGKRCVSKISGSSTTLHDIAEQAKHNVSCLSPTGADQTEGDDGKPSFYCVENVTKLCYEVVRKHQRSHLASWSSFKQSSNLISFFRRWLVAFHYSLSESGFCVRQIFRIKDSLCVSIEPLWKNLWKSVSE